MVARVVFTNLVVLLLLTSAGYAQSATSSDVASNEKVVAVGELRAQAISEMVHKERAAKSMDDAQDEDANTPMPFLDVLQGLGLIIGLFLVGMHLYKKYVLKQAPEETRRIKIIERRALTPKSALLLVQVEGRRVLVGVGSEAVTLAPFDSIELTEIVSDTEGFESSKDGTCHEVVKFSA